jgi:hypothetical protein
MCGVKHLLDKTMTLGQKLSSRDGAGSDPPREDLRHGMTRQGLHQRFVWPPGVLRE